MNLGEKILGTIAAARLDGKRAVRVVIDFEGPQPPPSDDPDMPPMENVARKWRAVLSIKEDRSVSKIVEELERVIPNYYHGMGVNGSFHPSDMMNQYAQYQTQQTQHTQQQLNQLTQHTQQQLNQLLGIPSAMGQQGFAGQMQNGLHFQYGGGKIN